VATSTNSQAATPGTAPPAETAAIPAERLIATGTPTPTQTATPLACWEEGGRYESGSLKTPLLRLPLEFSVYLPPCYDAQTERRYPALYLIHGQSFTHDQWDRLGVDETANALVGSGDLPPFLVVMPRDRLWEQPDKDMFGRAVVEELVPYIDEHYRSVAERDFRAIGGLSRGAGWAVHLGLSRWDLFGALGGHSLAVFWYDTSRIRGWLDAIPPESLPRIYLDIGEKDRPSILQSAIWFEKLLVEKGIPHEWYLFQGYHEEAYWQAHVEDYLRWYAQDW
jgi:enterochelin esterase-like enzyme